MKQNKINKERPYYSYIHNIYLYQYHYTKPNPINIDWLLGLTPTDPLQNFLAKVSSWNFEDLFGCLHYRVMLFVVQKDFKGFYYKNFDCSSFLDYIEHSLLAQDSQQHYLVGICNTLLLLKR